MTVEKKGKFWLHLLFHAKYDKQYFAIIDNCGERLLED